MKNQLATRHSYERKILFALKAAQTLQRVKTLFLKPAYTFSFPNSAPIMTTSPADAGKAGDIRDSVIQLCGSGYTRHRLLEIDSIPSYIGYGIMEEFAEQHGNEWLSRALKKRHPFAMFRDVVENANLLDQWYGFRDKKYGKLAMEWLDDNGIDFVDGKIIQLKEWKINHGEHIMNIGEYAPDFTLQDKDGKTVSLSDFKGRKVVVYFYPKDNTPGCSRQAVGFAENYNEFQKRNITVIGISKDSVESHVKFAEKYNLPFVLLSDPELTAIQAYGVWQEKKLYGKVSMGVVRTTFIIDEKGIIVDIMRKVKPDTNAADILAKIE